MFVNHESLKPTPPRSRLETVEYQFMMETVPDCITAQYALSIGQLANDRFEGLSPESILNHATSSIPENLSSLCDQILENTQRFLQPDCIKHVYAALTFKYTNHDGKAVTLTTFGVNGWNPLILDSRFLKSQEVRQRIETELQRLGVPIPERKLNKVVSELDESMYLTGLSCGQINQTLTTLGAPSDRSFYCRMGLHQQDKAQRLPNSNCPSAKHCAEGSAAHLKPIAVLLADIFAVDALTIIDAQPIYPNKLVIRFTPTLPQFTSQNMNHLHTITIDTPSTNPIKLILKILDMKSINTRLPMTPSEANQNYHLSLAENRFTLGVDTTENNLASNHNYLCLQDIALQPQPESPRGKITESVLISRYVPCPLCAVDICNPRQWDIPGLETNPPLVLFERFSRHDEKVDAGDIGPLAMLYLKGVNAFRFGLNLPNPTWR
jgi:hypothetical protein